MCYVLYYSVPRKNTNRRNVIRFTVHLMKKYSRRSTVVNMSDSVNIVIHVPGNLSFVNKCGCFKCGSIHLVNSVFLFLRSLIKLVIITAKCRQWSKFNHRGRNSPVVEIRGCDTCSESFQNTWCSLFTLRGLFCPPPPQKLKKIHV